MYLSLLSAMAFALFFNVSANVAWADEVIGDVVVVAIVDNGITVTTKSGRLATCGEGKAMLVQNLDLVAFVASDGSQRVEINFSTKCTRKIVPPYNWKIERADQNIILTSNTGQQIGCQEDGRLMLWGFRVISLGPVTLEQEWGCKDSAPVAQLN